MPQEITANKLLSSSPPRLHSLAGDNRCRLIKLVDPQQVPIQPAPSLFVDQEFRSLIPPLDATEYQQLEESIREDGCRDALIIWQGKNIIIDGHHRYDICTKHNIPYRIFEKPFKDKEEAKIWIKKNQIGRRNISPYLKAEYVFDVAEWEEMKGLAKENQGDRGNFVVNSQRSNIQLAHKLSIGEQQASRIIRIHKSPLTKEEEKAKLRTGELGVNTVYKEIKKREEKIERDKQRQELSQIGQQIANTTEVVIQNCDFRSNNGHIPADSIDLIFTDPNYAEDFLDVWQPLAELATRVLKPGAFLLVYSGQTFFPDVLKFLLSSGLEYYWLAGKYHDQGHVSIWAKKVWTQWKPILIFKKPGNSNSHKWFLDMLRMGARTEAKKLDNYGQSSEDAKYFIDKLSEPGDLILDPCCGSGTILAAAKMMGRKVMGFDINNDKCNITLARLAAIND